MEFLVFARIHLRKIKNKSSFIYGVVYGQWDHEIHPDEIEEEGRKLAKEIEQVKKEN